MSTALNAPEFLGWLGAPAKFAMALPEAKPTPSQMYCPRGVYLDHRVLVVADSGNHRLLIWHLENGALPANHSDAQVVVGQPDFYSEGAKLLHLPTGVTMVGDVLLVADAWHHRILGWKRLPVTGHEPPDFILGQRDLAQVEPNAGGEAGAGAMFWPYGLAYIAGRLYVADTGNRRVLYWNGLPDSFCAADGVIGQANFQDTAENRGQICANSFRWAHDLAGDEERLFIADAGNHRVLGFKGQPSADEEAVLLLGQTEFNKCEEFPYRPQSASCMRFPYSLSYAQGRLAVADTANNRVLIFRDLPESGLALSACQVIGQPDFEANGENNWKAVTNNSLCWPYGIHLFGEILAIADSGNNRVMFWKI
jgi:hypothetical protein